MEAPLAAVVLLAAPAAVAVLLAAPVVAAALLGGLPPQVPQLARRSILVTQQRPGDAPPPRARRPNAQARAQSHPAETLLSSFQGFLCLSRACLGKYSFC